MDLGGTTFGGEAKHFNMACYVVLQIGWKLGKSCQFIWQEEVVNLTVKYFGKPFKAVSGVPHIPFYPAYGAVVHRWIASGGKVPKGVPSLLSKFPDSFSWQFHIFIISILGGDFISPIW